MKTLLAPGKALLCGEYAVLHGAPAISVATDRCVRARLGETGQRSPFVDAARERAARLLERAPVEVAVDSAALYQGARKLGLGSSAAVTAAVVGAAFVEAGLSLDDRRRIFELADEAHAAAQGTRGSGVDVATSVWGGVIRFERRGGAAEIGAVALPGEVELTFVFTGESASTPDLLGRVKALAERDRAAHDSLMGRLIALAHAFAAACANDDAARLVSAAAGYAEAMRKLGEAAGAPLLTPELALLDQCARRVGGAAKPSGAGGGDLGVAFTTSPAATRALREELSQKGFPPLALGAPAPGLRLEQP